MHLDVHELRDFYRTPLGRMVRQTLSSAIRAEWPDVRGRRVVGVGHATPYLRPFLADAERVVAVMPAAEGCLPWPKEGPNRTALAFEHQLPLPDASVDDLLVVHALEATSDVHALLRELWRVLAPHGRILAIVPHRSGLWARTDTTPFGIGRPFSRSQLARLAEEAMFTVERLEPMLFAPPSSRRFWLATASRCERIGKRMLPHVAGAIALSGRKRMTMGLVEHRRRRTLEVLVPQMAGRAAVIRAGRISPPGRMTA